jgi:hypothetical protein
MRLFSGSEAGRVGIFVIKSGKFIRGAPIKGQLCRDYFYGKNKRAEKAFGSIEGKAAAIFADAVRHHRLPTPEREAHEWLTFYLGIQHSRTVAAAEQHNEGAEKTIKAMLRRQAELEGNSLILESLDKVRITRTNAVSEVVSYATIGASLLADLSFALVSNDSDVHFISSDTPVVLHNRLYENQHVAVTGYANVGLQLFLPLGPRLLLVGYDAAAYDVRRDGNHIVRVQDSGQIRLVNDLQWESAHAVLLTAPDASEDELRSQAADWSARRQAERTVFREEIVEQSETQVRTRQGGGQVPSTVALDLEFIVPKLPTPPRLGQFELPPIRNPERVARTDRAFAMMEEWDAARRGRV